MWLTPLGGPERKVVDIQPRQPSYTPLSIAWCPNSRCLLVTDSPGVGHPDAVFVVALDTLEKRQVTHPQGVGGDRHPAVSPDGRSVVFLRSSTPFSGEFHRLSVTDGMVPEGEPVRITSTLTAGKPSWLPDGREILFAAGGGLWRLNPLSGGTPTRLPFVGQDGHYPVVSRTAGGRLRLVYVRSFSDWNVWRVDTAASGGAADSTPVAAIASTRADWSPNLDTDGRRIAFVSDRSGELQIWVADTDGIQGDSADIIRVQRAPRSPTVVSRRQDDRVPQLSGWSARVDGRPYRWRQAAKPDNGGGQRPFSELLERRSVDLLLRREVARLEDTRLWRRCCSGHQG